MIKANAINIFEIDENLTAFSENIHKLLIPDFADYGIALERFFVTNIVKPDGDRQYEKFRSCISASMPTLPRRRSARRRISSMRRQRRRRWSSTLRLRPQSEAQEGYTYAQERGFDVAEKVAQNEAVGQFTNMGVGLGTMAGVGGAVGGVVGNAVGGVRCRLHRACSAYSACSDDR